MTRQRGAPAGNTNASKENRLWANAIRRAVMQSSGKKLRSLAECLIERANQGDISALRELGDRLDGKAAQSIGFEANSNELTIIHRTK